MATSIDQAFITQFEAEVHLAYQRFGSKLRNTCRVKNSVQGSTVKFQKVAKGTATTKSRHGDVPPMNQTHSNVSATLVDYYAGDYVDDLDELKTNIDERMIIARSGAAALGRQTDSLITTAMDGVSTHVIAHGSAAITLAKAETAFETLGNNDVPDDGDRWWVVSPQQWTDLLGLTQFASADYVSMDDLPFKGGMTAKRWLGFTVFPFSGLPKSSTTRSGFAYHRSAIGHAVGSEVRQDITWQGQKQAYFIVNKMSQGSVIIDEAGIVEVQSTES